MTTPAAPDEPVPVETALRALLDEHGPALIDEPALLRSLLSQRSPDAAHDVACVVIAVDAQVPRTLLDARDRGDLRAQATALESRLRHQHGMNRYAAAWTIAAWTTALRLPVPEADAEHVTGPTPPPVSPTGAASGGPPMSPPVPPHAASAAPAARPSMPRRRATRRAWLPAGLTIVSACALAFLTIALVRSVDRAARRSETTGPPATRAAAQPAAIDRADPAPSAPHDAPSDPARPPLPQEAPVASARPTSPTASSVPSDDDPGPPRKPAPRRTPVACRPAACGTVVGVHEVSAAASSTGAADASPGPLDRRSPAAPKRYDIVVRFDDRDVRTLRSAGRFRTGERVRVVDGDERLVGIVGPR